MRAQEVPEHVSGERPEGGQPDAGPPASSAVAEPEASRAAPEEGTSRARTPEPDDLFYHGTIATVNWSRGDGVVRSDNGREIPFDFQFVTMIGGRRRIEHLLPGMRVGFDVGWTSKGLRITAIKIYD